MTNALTPEPNGLEVFLTPELAMNTRVQSGVPKLGNLIDRVLGAKCVSRGHKTTREYFWGAEHFGLENVAVFRNLPEELKVLALKALTDHNLHESYYIEKNGMSYCAKMILLSESEEEKALYASMANDEATHLYEVKNFVSGSPEAAYTGNKFLRFIAEVVEKESPRVCQAVLQVGLEGHGLGYYHWLRSGCREEKFREVLTRIIADEASHHGSGVLLSSHAQFTDAEKRRLDGHFFQLAYFLNCTHFPTVMVLEKLTGGLSSAQRVETFQELRSQAGNTEKMHGLRHLTTIGKLEPLLSPAVTAQMNEGWDAAACATAFSKMLSGA